MVVRVGWKATEDSYLAISTGESVQPANSPREWAPLACKFWIKSATLFTLEKRAPKSPEPG